MDTRSPHDLVGKNVWTCSYVHVSALPLLSPEFQKLTQRALRIANVTSDRDFNVIRIDSQRKTVAFLLYPRFIEQAFPTLAKSWKVDLGTGCCSIRRYDDSLNPPILHRKELLLPPDHQGISAFRALSKEAERIGLFDDPLRIGFKLQWERLLAERGFRVVGHQLVPIGNEVGEPAALPADIAPAQIARHLTALSRQNFSAPIQLLWRLGLLDDSRDVFDYGCGKGDDVRGLVDNGIVASGWDPYYAPDSTITPAKIVNLGFVINVIENQAERQEALQRAFALAEELLVVSAMIAADNPSKAIPFADGVLTSRLTFQK